MFATPGMQNCGLMIIAIVLDGAPAWWSGKVVKMTDMPQTVAIYSGMGGGAAATIAALEFARGEIHGAVSFSGSCVAFANLQGLMHTAWHLPAQNALNIVLAVVTVLVGIGIVLGDAPTATQIIAGIVLGAAGTRLTQRMAKAINRPISNTLFSPIAGEAQAGSGPTGTMKGGSSMDAASMMRSAQKVIIVPGYGMAVAGARHKVHGMTKLLEAADVPCERIFDLEEINEEFALADVALVIGANDVVNPVARTDKTCPICGMPILNADKTQNVIVIKRGKGAGYSGIGNALFFEDSCRLCHGSAQGVVGEMIGHIKALS